MQQTLLFIPHAWFEGRLLIGWLVLCALVFVWLLFRHGWTQEVWSYLPVMAIGALVIHFVLPQLEVYGVNPADPAGEFVKQGLAVRGYGVCLLLAIVAGVGVTLLRCKSAGIEPDHVLSLAFWMIISGIFGARCFYVVQKSDEFFGRDASLSETLVGVLDMTKGGLVVYGSLIGGTIAALIFFRITRLPVWKTADLIAPGMMLGLAIGRIGCLMNGCCYGGICDVEGLPSLKFPAGSPPYMQQLRYGDLLGMKTIPNDADEEFVRTVTLIEMGAIADQLGIRAGDHVTVFTPDQMRVRFFKQQPNQWNEARELVLYVDSDRQGQLVAPLSPLSSLSHPIHPTQIYSSINAFLLCGVLWFFWPVRKYDGEVFALMLVLYSIARFLLEIVREDESGVLGTGVTPSQWVSVGTLVMGLVMFWRRERTPEITEVARNKEVCQDFQ